MNRVFRGVSTFTYKPAISRIPRSVPTLRTFITHHVPRTTLLLAMTLSHRSASAADAPPTLGQFIAHSDIGSVRHPGSAEFFPERASYLVAGGGANIWSTNHDAFHYVWKQMSGDLTLAADIQWLGETGDPHRKACLMIRQSLDPNAEYADAALHGNGLASLQYRETAGSPTREIQSNVSSPTRLRLEKRGDYVSISIAPPGEALRPAGGSFRLQFQEPFYVGLAVCAHDNNSLEKAVFSNVELAQLAPAPDPAPDTKIPVTSTLETISIKSLDRRVVYHTTNHIEAPNWSRDGKYFIYNSYGRLFKLPVEGGTPEPIPTGFAKHCNNDHGISPDGTQIVISDQTEEKKSIIYILPITGGEPKRITALGPSYWHGWSPDGKTLAYCAQRNDNFDIYTIPVTGGEETRLTTAPGLDDGPDYSPDGKYIYFNSERTGLMQIWRMKTDGSDQEQVTQDEYNNWFAHPSPDGKWIVYLTYPKEVKGHPEGKDVMLRLMPATGGEPRILAKLFGGQGTINVPSWSPDSTHLAFVSYQPVAL